MKKKQIYKLIGNLLILVLIVAIIVYLLQNSLDGIIQQLFQTNLFILVTITLLGIGYCIVEGKTFP